MVPSSLFLLGSSKLQLLFFFFCKSRKMETSATYKTQSFTRHLLTFICILSNNLNELFDGKAIRLYTPTKNIFSFLWLMVFVESSTKAKFSWNYIIKKTYYVSRINIVGINKKRSLMNIKISHVLTQIWW